MATVSWYAWLALRRRVSMSAIGSVIVIGLSNPSRPGSLACRAYGEDLYSPGSLRHTGELTTVSHVPDADPAEAELAVDGLRPAAALATGVGANRELRLRGRFEDQRLLGHLSSP